MLLLATVEHESATSRRYRIDIRHDIAILVIGEALVRIEPISIYIERGIDRIRIASDVMGERR